MKEANAVALFPGGFGTLDEAYECLTLVQTGKAGPMPIVFIDAPGGSYWNAWRDYVEHHLLRNGLISEEDLTLFRITDDAGKAVEEIRGFYRIYHSSRYVGEKLVMRLARAPDEVMLEQIEHDFADIAVNGRFQVAARALPEEDADDTAALPRLVFQFNRVNFGRLRQLVDFLNQRIEESADDGRRSSTT
jgi:hypothetical protein